VSTGSPFDLTTHIQYNPARKMKRASHKSSVTGGKSTNVGRYNPLSPRNLGRSIATAILHQELHPFPPKGIPAGSGIYAVYYSGQNSLYAKIVEYNAGKQFLKVPVYVGKAQPKSRVGMTERAAKEKARYVGERVDGHYESILATNGEGALSADDFHFRFLIIDPFLVALGESLLIELFKPVWNSVVGGFGNNPLGKGRKNQKRSSWDTMHPGRVSRGIALEPNEVVKILEKISAHVDKTVTEWMPDLQKKIGDAIL
jgi:hypothetical protein